MKIPRILHQTGPERLSSWMAACQASLQRHHPGWTYRFWTDADLAELVHTHYPEAAAAFDAFPLIQKTDLARYCILHRFGGVYSDLDIEWHGPIDPLLTAPLMLAHSPPTLPGGPSLVTNYLMASIPHHPLWQQVVHEIVRRHEKKAWPWWAVNASLRVPFLTGARVLSAVVEPEHLHVFREPHILNLFCAHTPLAPETVAVHRGGTARVQGSKWNSLNGFIQHECTLRRLLGVRGNLCQFPYLVVLLYGLIGLVLLCIGVRAIKATASETPRV